MKLTSYSNFALRSLQLAAIRHPGLTRVEEVARAHGLSHAHITKIVHELGKAGFVETVRGRNGGFRLARPADQISVGDIIRWTEGPVELVECFNPSTNTCPLIGVCHLSAKLREATNAFLAVLDGVTIADIAHNKSVLLDRFETAMAEPSADPHLSAAV